jgi:cysteinyl-tRNA synthetase
VIRLHDTLTRSLQPLVTQVPGKVGIYVCGMTVYDFSHIGHARMMFVFDMVVRHLRHRGLEVTYVRNHTDVDDKIIARAQQTGEHPLAVSARFIRELEVDAAALGMLAPSCEPAVSRHMPQILELVQALVDRGHAYATPGGDVWFSVESFPRYGRLSGKKLEDLRAGERVAVDDQKRHPGDFALWKANKGEAVAWDSPWGPGRPGWHIECSAMSRACLGDTFDIHGGGIDLLFPHHENEVAQSEAGTGASPFARYWMHNGHLTLSTEKMSKSLGNIVRIRDITEQVPGEVVRLMYGATHYRSPLPYTSELLAESLAGLDRIYCAREAIERAAGDAAPEALGEAGREVHRLGLAFGDAFDAAMDDDFNSAQAIAHFYELVRAVNRFGNDKKALAKGAKVLEPARAAFERMATVIGIGGMDPAAFFDDVKHKRLRAAGRSAAEVEARIGARAAARAAKDWAAADAIRLDLDAQGIVVMDGPTGSTWRMKVA